MCIRDRKSNIEKVVVHEVVVYSVVVHRLCPKAAAPIKKITVHK